MWPRSKKQSRFFLCGVRVCTYVYRSRRQINSPSSKLRQMPAKKHNRTVYKQYRLHTTTIYLLNDQTKIVGYSRSWDFNHQHKRVIWGSSYNEGRFRCYLNSWRFWHHVSINSTIQRMVRKRLRSRYHNTHEKITYWTSNTIKLEIRST